MPKRTAVLKFAGCAGNIFTFFVFPNISICNDVIVLYSRMPTSSSYQLKHPQPTVATLSSVYDEISENYTYILDAYVHPGDPSDTFELANGICTEKMLIITVACSVAVIIIIINVLAVFIIACRSRFCIFRFRAPSHSALSVN